MIDDESARKLAEMGSRHLADELRREGDDPRYLAMPFDERIRLAVDAAYQADVAAKISSLVGRARLRYPQADVNTLVDLDGRGIGRDAVANLSTCAYVTAATNVIIQGFTGSGKSFLLCALLKEACKRRMRALYIRMPDLEEELCAARERPQGATKLLKRLSGYTVLALDEWLLDKPDAAMLRFLLELMERRYDARSTLFATQYQEKDWHSRLGGGVQADAIMDRIVHNAVTITTGETNMRESLAKRGGLMEL